MLPSIQLSTATSLLLLTIPTLVSAVYRDEVGHLDYHHELLGVPQRETTFFHRPRHDDKASLLYTLSDVGVLGAVNPSSGAVLWRQLLNDSVTNGGGFLRASDGEGWVASALGNTVHSWDAVSGRNRFRNEYAGEVKDLEIMALTEHERKDVLVLFDEGDVTILRRINGNDGSVVWEFKETTKDLPLQVSTNVEKVFVISLHGSSASYSLKVSVLDTLTGKRLDELLIGTKGDVHGPEDVILVGANSAAPIVAWVDKARSKLRINVLGTKTKQEFSLWENTVSVEVHAPSMIQSLPHFLVHAKTHIGSRAEVFHVDLKRNVVEKAYEVPHIAGFSAFSTSSHDANVYFNRITENELILLSSEAHGVLARWPLNPIEAGIAAVHAVSEVIKKAGSTDSYAVRSAAVTDADDWVMVRNGDIGWTRPEGLSGAVAAAFAEIPESAEFAQTLLQEAYGSPLVSYIHRVKRHINELQHLPEYLQKVPSRLINGILGSDEPSVQDGLARDSFGFNKLVILATRRGRLYGLDVARGGRIIWNKKVFAGAIDEHWDIKGMHVVEQTGHVQIRGARGDFVEVKVDTGATVTSSPPSLDAVVQSTALVSSLNGDWLLPVNKQGKADTLDHDSMPAQIVVVSSPEGWLEGKKYLKSRSEVIESPIWTFKPLQGQHIVKIANRPTHDVTASIGRVLGDRTVKYKYLNPNSIVVAAVDERAATLTTYLLDTVSGQILASETYNGVDTQKHIDVVAAENWFVVTFFGQYSVRDESGQSLKGYHVVVSDLYESEFANDRGPLGDAANFSSIDPIEVPTGIALPSVVSQSYIVGSPLTALQVTQTRQGISSRQVLAYLPESHAIAGLPRHVLEPRRPVGRDATAAEAEEGLLRYTPGIEVDPRAIITHERDVLGINKIITTPAMVESTSLVFAYGLDVFGTRVSPSQLYDILGKGFNKVSLISTVLALGAGVFAVGPTVRGKQINMRWRA